MNDSAYVQGYEYSMSGQADAGDQCPYPEDTKEYDDWWEGFGDATEDYIAHQRSD